jgi:DNA repair protein RadC
MTAKQKAAREKFKKVVAEAAKLRKKNPSLTQAQAVKQAFAISYSKAGETKKVGVVKKKAAPKKKAATKKTTGSHKDTKSHNVNIRVVSGTKKKKVGDYKNRDTVYKDPRGINTNAKGDYKVIRNKAGKFAYFNKIGAKMPSEFVSLSGYKFGKEIIVAGVSKLSTLKNLVPDVKLRVTRGKKTSTDTVKSSTDAAEIFKRFIGKNKIETQELVAVAYLNTANKVLGVYVHSIGSISSASVDVRLVLAGALQMGAVGLILCHNHPSGNLKPSDADKTMTKQLIKATSYHNINVLDHIIITKESHFSFAENGLL